MTTIERARKLIEKATKTPWNIIVVIGTTTEPRPHSDDDLARLAVNTFPLTLKLVEFILEECSKFREVWETTEEREKPCTHEDCCFAREILAAIGKELGDAE